MTRVTIVYDLILTIYIFIYSFCGFSTDVFYMCIEMFSQIWGDNTPSFTLKK